MRAVALAAIVLALGLAVPGSASPTAQERGFRVLAFSKTAGFRHSSISAAVAALRELGARNGFGVNATEDAAVFSDSGLAPYDVVVFLLTTGDVLVAEQQAAFERFVGKGGGYVGVHSASDTEYDWPWYGRLVGAYFRTHGSIQPATIVVADARHPSTRPIPTRWTRTDEWYSFQTNPRASVHVLATLDETSYDVGDAAMGDHPIAWSQEYAGGRAWYTAGGHTEESYSEPLFLAHLLGGIRYAAGLGAPRVVGVAATVRGRRVAITVRHDACRRCAGRLLAARHATELRDDGHVARGRTRVLPSGRNRITVVLENRLSGRVTTVRRWIVVR